jgi:hypothetical protein
MPIVDDYNDNMDRSLSSTKSSAADTANVGEDSSRITSSNENRNEENDALAKNETHNVNLLRATVAMVLISSTVGIVLAIYFFVRHSEQSDFNIGYASDADRVMDGIGMGIHDSLSAMASFGTLMASYAQQSNQSFPFFTLPGFAVKASRLLTITAGIQISIQTVVTSEQRLKWEAYTLENEWWVNETKSVQEIDQFYYGDVPYGVPNRGVLFNYTHELPYEPK